MAGPGDEYDRSVDRLAGGDARRFVGVAAPDDDDAFPAPRAGGGPRRLASIGNAIRSSLAGSADRETPLTFMDRLAQVKSFGKSILAGAAGASALIFVIPYVGVVLTALVAAAGGAVYAGNRFIKRYIQEKSGQPEQTEQPKQPNIKTVPRIAGATLGAIGAGLVYLAVPVTDRSIREDFSDNAQLSPELKTSGDCLSAKIEHVAARHGGPEPTMPLCPPAPAASRTP